jgi:hypothetical protein
VRYTSRPSGSGSALSDVSVWRWFAQAGLVIRASLTRGANIRSSERESPPKHKSDGIRLPIAWWGARRTSHFESFLLRHLCLEIGRRGWGRGTVLMTFVSGVHNPKIMLGMLVKVLRGDSIATRRRLARKGNVTFEDLMRGTSDFDVRTVTIEGLTSVQYLWPITVGIVTVIATMRSAGLSWSHDTCCIDGEIGWLSNESISEPLPSRVGRCRTAFLYQRKALCAGTLDGAVFIPNRFLVQCPTSGSHRRPGHGVGDTARPGCPSTP